MKKKFEAFLRKHKALSEFKRLVKSQYGESLDGFIDDVIIGTDATGLIYCVDFDDSKKPFKFWQNLNDLWIEELIKSE